MRVFRKCKHKRKVIHGDSGGSASARRSGSATSNSNTIGLSFGAGVVPAAPATVLGFPLGQR